MQNPNKPHGNTGNKNAAKEIHKPRKAYKTVQLLPEDYEKAAEIAKERNISIAGLIRCAIAAYANY